MRNPPLYSTLFKIRASFELLWLETICLRSPKLSSPCPHIQAIRRKQLRLGNVQCSAIGKYRRAKHRNCAVAVGNGRTNVALARAVLCVLSDGRLVSGSYDKTIRLWDLMTGAETAGLEVDTYIDCLVVLANTRPVARGGRGEALARQANKPKQADLQIDVEESEASV
jgi:hypothetical protein